MRYVKISIFGFLILLSLNFSSIANASEKQIFLLDVTSQEVAEKDLPFKIRISLPDSMSVYKSVTEHALPMAVFRIVQKKPGKDYFTRTRFSIKIYKRPEVVDFDTLRAYLEEVNSVGIKRAKIKIGGEPGWSFQQVFSDAGIALFHEGCVIIINDSHDKMEESDLFVDIFSSLEFVD